MFKLHELTVPAWFSTVQHSSIWLHLIVWTVSNWTQPCQPGAPHLAMPAQFDFVVWTESNRAGVNTWAFAVKMANWTEDETLCLITLWGEDSIQSQIEGCQHNSAIFPTSKADERSSLQSTGDHCREKITHDHPEPRTENAGKHVFMHRSCETEARVSVNYTPTSLWIHPLARDLQSQCECGLAPSAGARRQHGFVTVPIWTQYKTWPVYNPSKHTTN